MHLRTNNWQNMPKKVRKYAFMWIQNLKLYTLNMDFEKKEIIINFRIN